MLTTIRVGNFKAFADPQRIPIRPPTLIHGRTVTTRRTMYHPIDTKEVRKVKSFSVYFVCSAVDYRENKP